MLSISRSQDVRTPIRGRFGAWRMAILAGLMVGASVGVLGGCSAMGRHDDTPVATSPVQHPLLANVPLPNGFELVDDRSRVSSSGGVRFAQCEFVGKAPRGNVLEFFKEYMPTGGWQLRDERLIAGVYELRYDSEREKCDVRLRQDGSKTHIDIDLRPMSDAPADRDTRPAKRGGQ